MLSELCAMLHNYFEQSGGVQHIHSGTYEIKGGRIALPFLVPGQRFRIKGSALNDGVYTYNETRIQNDDNTHDAGLDDETFTGEVWAMFVPKDARRIAAQAAKWKQDNAGKAFGPFTSESFNGYSYSKEATGESGFATGTWYGVPVAALKQWGKPYELD